MNLITNDLASLGSATVQLDGAKVNGDASGSTGEGATFGQLLSQLIGKGGQGEFLPRAVLPTAYLLPQHLTLLGDAGAASEDDQASLLEWLEQVLSSLEQLPEEVMNGIDIPPQLAPILLSFADGQAAAEQSFTTPSEHGSNIRLPALLKETVQQMIVRLSGEQVSADAIDRAKGFQQLLEPLLTRIGQGSQAADGSRFAGTVAETGVNGSVAQPGMEAARSMNRDFAVFRISAGQHAGHAAGDKRNVGPTQSVQISARTILLQQHSLPRPELLNLAVGEGQGETQPDGIRTEAPNHILMWAGEGLKTAGEWSLMRPMTHALPQVPANEFAEHLNQFIVKSFQVTRLNGLSEAKISLVPEHLGQVEIKLIMQNGQLSAQLVTETVQGRDLLEQQIGALRQSLQSQGIQVERLEVTHHASETSAFFRDHGQQQQSFRQGQQEPQTKRATYDDYAVESDFHTELADISDELYMQGRSFHATA